ncbi:helix-turn-helix transcriptional regulator [Litorimonas sp. RW-G-Af-16]|uniref:S24 family peptidase n=1 Tax=Litorimonas sp. RW-G-Af-16 TaxID=3241168 RepID=UPI00390C90BB
MFRLIKVKGTSMVPTLMPGDYVLTKKPRFIRAGLIYVIEHERHGLIVKRATRLEGDLISYVSDNSEGSSGQVSAAQVKRVAWLAITPKGVRRI